MKRLKWAVGSRQWAIGICVIALTPWTIAQIQVDLSPYFNVDAIFNNVDIFGDSGGFFLPLGSWNYTARGNTAFREVDGLPPNGVLNSTAEVGMGQYQLAPYTGLNCLQLGSGSSPVTVEVPDGNYTKLGFLAAAANGGALIDCGVIYRDGSFDSFPQFIVAPDWFDHGTFTPEVITGMDRVRWVNNRWEVENANSPAIFESFVEPNPTKVVDRLVVGGGWFWTPNRTEAGIFAINGKTTQGNIVQFDLSGVFNQDAIWAGGAVTGDPAGYFDNPNRYNYTVEIVLQQQDGLPEDGVLNSTDPGLGGYQLGNYAGLNAIQLTRSRILTMEVPNGNYRKIGLLSAASGGTLLVRLALTIVYADGSRDTGLFLTVPDWFNHTLGVPEVITGMDRVRWDGTRWHQEDSNSAAIFENFIFPRRGKEVDQLIIGPFTLGSGLATIFALNVQRVSDVISDGCINDLDLAQVLGDFGTTISESDVNGDGIVNADDLSRVLLDFASGC